MDVFELQATSSVMRQAAISVIAVCDTIDAKVGDLVRSLETLHAFLAPTPEPTAEGTAEGQGKPLIALVGPSGPKAKGKPTRLDEGQKQQIVKEWHELPRHRRFGKSREASVQKIAKDFGIQPKVADRVIRHYTRRGRQRAA